MKKLFRQKEGSVLGGVCTGLSTYFDIDISIIRILFVIAAITQGFGILMYLILWIVIPSESSKAQDPKDVMKENAKEIEEEVSKNIKKNISSDSKKK